MGSLVLQRCAHHADRRGFALCMSCRKVVCQECATPWDGVYHCRSCLSRRGAEASSRRRIAPWIACALFCAAAFLLASRALAWSAALFAGLW